MIKDHSQYGATESQYLIQKRAIQPYKVICGIQTYIDYLHQNLLFFVPEGRINFGMGDVAGLTQTACNYATMLKIPQGVTINYFIVGGGGAGEDHNAINVGGHFFSGGNGGQVLTGSFVLPASTRLEIYAGLGGAAPTFGKTGVNGNNNGEITFAQAGQASTIKKGQVGNTTLLVSASGGFQGGYYPINTRGGYGGNGINPPTSYIDNYNYVYVGGDGIPTTSLIDGSTIYSGAGGGGGNPDDSDIAQNGTTTPPNFGLGGTTGNYYADDVTPTAGLGGIVMLSAPSNYFGKVGSYVGASRVVPTSGSTLGNTILVFNGAGTYTSY